MQLRDWVEETAARLEERMAAAERRIDGCVAYTSLVRYDAWGEMSGQQSSTHGAARRPPHRRGRLVDPPPRPGARLREAAARRASRSWSCRPRSSEAIEAAMAGARRGAARLMRRRRTWVPPGPTARRRCARPRPPGVEEVPYPTIYDAVMAVQEGEVDRAVVPIENALEGAVSVTLDTLAARGRRRAHRGRGRAPDPPLRRRGAGARPRRGHARRVPSAGDRPVRGASCASGSPRRRARRRCLDRGRGAVRARRRRAGGRRSGRGWRPSSTAAASWSPTSRTTPTTPPASCGSRPPRRPASPASDGKTSLVFWGGGDQSPGWLVRALRELADRGVNLTRIESRPRRTSLGHYMFFVDLEGGAGAPLVAEALAALRGAGRGAARSRVVHRLRAGRPAKLARPSWQ